MEEKDQNFVLAGLGATGVSILEFENPLWGSALLGVVTAGGSKLVDIHINQRNAEKQEKNETEQKAEKFSEKVLSEKNCKTSEIQRI